MEPSALLCLGRLVPFPSTSTLPPPPLVRTLAVGHPRHQLVLLRPGGIRALDPLSPALVLLFPPAMPLPLHVSPLGYLLAVPRRPPLLTRIHLNPLPLLVALRVVLALLFLLVLVSLLERLFVPLLRPQDLLLPLQEAEPHPLRQLRPPKPTPTRWRILKRNSRVRLKNKSLRSAAPCETGSTSSKSRRQMQVRPP